MKIAIHHRIHSFSERWIEYCKTNQIDFKIVNCYDFDIINQLKDFDALMWHHSHDSYKDLILAKKLLHALESQGKIVFPNYNTGWHFDDKISQKYLSESLKLKIVDTYLFYDKKNALNWLKKTNLPKVFKLSGGAGATNVKLVRTRKDGVKLVKKAFGSGFKQFREWDYFKDTLSKLKNGYSSPLDVLKAFIRILCPNEFSRMSKKEKGYVYFQEFLPKNNFDIRVVVIDKKMFAIKRMTRENDFRASGSGNIIYDPNQIPKECLKMALNASKTLKSQCMGYDFVYDQKNNPVIVEYCFGFSVEPYDLCPGYWDADLNWFEEKFNPQSWMIQNVIESFNDELKKNN